ncbi:MAG: universal stress protein [Burkholderiales bacterium]|nr:universal stress protein [Burkholderiales bacterium]
MFKHILISTDGSEVSKRALDKGAALAKALGAEVTLVTAIEKYPVGMMGDAYRAEDNPMHQAARDAAAHWLGEAQTLVEKHGIKARQHISENRSIHQGILEAAKTSGADLIVMGTHGAGALERLIVGSQTQRVLAHTDIPVLVVH